MQSLKSFDVSGSDVNDLRAIALLDNLTELDISKTKIDVKDLALISDKKLKRTYLCVKWGLKLFDNCKLFIKHRKPRHLI